MEPDTADPAPGAADTTPDAAGTASGAPDTPPEGVDLTPGADGHAMFGSLGFERLALIDAQLASTDAFLERTYPGETGRRQPVHTVYVPADRYAPDLPRRWGDEAIAAVEAFGGIETLCAELGLDPELTAQVGPRVMAKLRSEPIEDLRVDFEDGYGDRGDAPEDAALAAAVRGLREAQEQGAGTPFFGIRFKCFEAPTRRRGLRTLDGFVTGMTDRGRPNGEVGASGAGGEHGGGEHGGGERSATLPEGLVLTLPKVSTVSQVEAMVVACEGLEEALGLERGRIGFEIQVETPQLILGHDGRIPVVAALHAGGGRVTSLHYGTYDYSASLGVSAEYQSMEHPVADQAKALMQLAVAGTGVHLSDGSTNVLPVGDREQVAAAWRLHHRLVTRSLAGAIYQGWDLHPGHLPTRFIATYAFYREGFPRAAGRLHAYVHQTGGAVLDEPATARALARYLYRGVVCGAIDEAELLDATGLTAARLELLARPKSDTEHVLSGAPTSDTPTSGAPASDTSTSDTSTSGAPTSGAPTSGTPTSGTPASDTPTSDPAE